MPRPRTTPTVLDQQVAASLGAPPELGPVLGELFEGIDSLGLRPPGVVRLLREAGVRRGSRVLELACGKGATAEQIARETGASVLGIDACPAFIAAAAAAAREAGVGARCRFRVGDVSNLRGPREFDAAVMLGLFGAEDAMELLRGCVRPGGVYMFDDAVSVSSRGMGRDAPSIREIREAVREIGDELLWSRVVPVATVRSQADRLNAALARNARQIEASHPEYRRWLRAFVANQNRAVKLLGAQLRPALVLARRAQKTSGRVHESRPPGQNEP